MAFRTDAQIKIQLAATLHTDLALLPDWWDTIIITANDSAYQEIVSRLLIRGYSKAQIDTWDRGNEFEVYIALYRALIQGANAQAYDDRWPEKLKYWVDQLAEIAIAVNGVIVAPAGAFSPFGHGKLLTGDDIFVVPVGTDRGEETQW